MKNISSFIEFSSLNEALKPDLLRNQYYKCRFKLETENPEIPKIDQVIHFFVGESSSDFFNMFGPGYAQEVSKWCGIPVEDFDKHMKEKGGEEDGALIMGMSNVVGPNIIYQWHNATRMRGAVKEHGLWPALLEEISHESIHTARLVLARQYYFNKGIGEKWVEEPTVKEWISIGDNPKKNIIDEETFATVQGKIVEALTTKYLAFMNKYINISYPY